MLNANAKLHWRRREGYTDYQVAYSGQLMPAAPSLSKPDHAWTNFELRMAQGAGSVGRGHPSGLAARP